MLTPEERCGLQELLAHAVNPAEAMTPEQLEGYLFGLAITPDVIQPIEWFLDIFGESFAEFADTEQANARCVSLISAYDRLIALRQQGELLFPFDLSDLDPATLERLRGWVTGLDRALALRSYIWMPEEVLDQPELSEDDDRIMTCLMVVLGVAQPEQIPDIFQGVDESADELHDFWAQLVGQLPVAVNTLIDYSGKLGELRPASV